MGFRACWGEGGKAKHWNENEKHGVIIGVVVIK